MMGISKAGDRQDTADSEAFSDPKGVTATETPYGEEMVETEAVVAENESEDDLDSEYVEERECNDIITRAHRNGATRSDASFSLWDSIAPMTQDMDSYPKSFPDVRERPTSKWDRLFQLKGADADDQEMGDDGLDDLLNLFDDEDADEREVEVTSNAANASEITSLALLSQGAQESATCIIEKVGSKGDMLKQACPNWKENVSFALLQDDNEAIRHALDNVQKSRRHLLKVRQQILNAWERQNAALEVFETALEVSSQRLNAKSSTSRGRNHKLNTK